MPAGLNGAQQAWALRDHNPVEGRQQKYQESPRLPNTKWHGEITKGFMYMYKPLKIDNLRAGPR